MEGEAIRRLDCSVPAVRRDQLGAGCAEFLRDGGAEVRLVADEPLGNLFDAAGVEGLAEESDISWRSTGHVDGGRKTMAIRNCPECGAPFTRGRALPKPLFSPPQR